MKRILTIPMAWVAVLSFLMTACGTASPNLEEPAVSPTPESISLTDGLGRTITLSSPAQRIVSLAPSNTEVLFAVGAGEQVVGRDDFSDYPAEAAALPTVGGSMGNYDAEAIVALQPDIVLAAGINPPELVQTLEELGLAVYYLGNPTDMEGMYKNLETVALLTGKTLETETLISQLKERVSAVEEKMAGVEEQPLVFYELDASDPLAPFTSGPGTFVDLLISKAGGKNLASSKDSSWVQISLEELVTENPGIILLGDAVWGGITPELVAARAGWETLAAVQNNQVFPFDDNLVSRPGPRLVDGLEQLARLLHPELFE
jgi:iron complex transport system substrate-binding protein